MASALARKENPFQQADQYWRVRVMLPKDAALMAEHSFDAVALAVSSFEDEKNPSQWRVDLLCEGVPDMTEINQRLLVLSALFDIEITKPEMQVIEQQDWVIDIARSFPPIHAGRFFVCGTHYQGLKPHGSIPLLIDAGAAFGSGEHGTTYGCLRALEWIARRRTVRHVLDVGCGSGILGIGAAKLLKCPVIAVDLDPVAAQVTAENIRLNRVNQHVRAGVSDGYQAPLVRTSAPYDLIFSNILARPLMALAPDLARNLAPEGVAVLSGLLDSQESMVMSAHRAQGLRLLKRIPFGEWRTLIIGR